MLRLLFIAILTTTTYTKKLSKQPFFIDLINELCKNGGKWILAGTGSNGIPPPKKSCIELTITNNGSLNGCILVAHNHTAHKTKVIQLVGINEYNETEILSEAPIHQYMIKHSVKKAIKELDNEVDWDAAISSPLCWSPKSHKIRSLRYIVTPIDETTEHVYLIAISPRVPIPEYQVAILTKTKMRRRYVEKMIKMVNYKNFIYLEKREDTPGLFARHSLPRVQLACAEGYDMQDPYDTINQELLDMKFDKDSPPFPDKEFRTILVKHQ